MVKKENPVLIRVKEFGAVICGGTNQRNGVFMTLNRKDYEFILEHLNYPDDKDKQEQYYRVVAELKAILRYAVYD